MLYNKHRCIRSYLGELHNYWVMTTVLLAHLAIFSLFRHSGTNVGIMASQAMLIPLYSSFSKEGILANLNRRLILSLITKNAGITFSEIKQELELQNGVLAYHLSLLEKNRHIKSFSDGKFKRFYAKGAQLTGLTSAEELIMSVIQSNPYISRRSIAQRIKYSQGTVNLNLKRLLQKELIDMEKQGKHYTYYSKN